jgi:uncharacterized protein YpmS
VTGVKWKTLFVALLVCNILVISVIVILVNWPVKDKELTNYINKGNEIQFQPNDQSIYVSLHDMKLKSNVRVEAKEFDLEHNNISFLLTMP